MRKFHLLTSLFCFGMLLNGASASAADSTDDVLEVLESGRVNWSTRELLVRGTGAPELRFADMAEARLTAERVAKAHALGRARALFASLRVEGAQTVSQRSGSAPQPLRMFEHRVVETRYFSDGGVDVAVAVPFAGMLAPLMKDLGADIRAPAGTATSGVVVDAQGLDARPAASPRIYAASGALVYGASRARPAAVALRGLAGYTRTMDAAIRDPLVAGQPLIVKPLRLRTSRSADFVVSDADAEKIRRLGPALADARVMIVTDAGKM